MVSARFNQDVCASLPFKAVDIQRKSTLLAPSRTAGGAGLEINSSQAQAVIERRGTDAGDTLGILPLVRLMQSQNAPFPMLMTRSRIV
jgi:hypothetical protein